MIYLPMDSQIKWKMTAEIHSERFRVLEVMQSVEIVMTDDSEKFYLLQLAYYHKLTDIIIIFENQ